jgi:outer membrane protein
MRRFYTLQFVLSLLFVAPVAGLSNPPAGKLTLQQAVELALKNHPTVHAAEAYSQAVRESIAVAKAGRYPRVDFSEGFTRGNNPVYVFGSLLTQRQFTARNFDLGLLNAPPPLSNFRTQFTAILPLYDSGKTQHRIRDARLDAATAQRGAERTNQQVIFNVVTSYFDDMLARESVRVAESAVEMANADLARAEARRQQGLTVPSDVLSAQVQLAQTKEDLIRARNGLAMAQASLNVAMGIPEDAAHEIEVSVSERTFEGGTLAERQQRALVQRPDYQQVTLQRERAANGVSASRAAFLPNVELFSAWEEDNQAFLTRGGNNWAAGVSVTFNLFNGGADRARLRESKARERWADALREQRASEIRLEVREAFLNLNAARERADVSRESAAQASESLRILRDRYEAGLATIADLLRAENAQSAAERNYLNAVYDHRIAEASLELATGELAANSLVVTEQSNP